MIVGCPKEVKLKEYRVGLTPVLARTLIEHNHRVIIQKGAGCGVGISDDDYEKVGATIVDDAKEVWLQAEMIIKVKEPIASEFDHMQDKQILFTFLHLAAEKKLALTLLEKKITAIAYETVEEGNCLPLLKPMSEVAGRLSVQAGAWCLQESQGGKGALLGGATGVKRCKVSIIGGGVVGINAAKIAVGMGSKVTILDTNLQRLEYLDHLFGNKIQTLFAAQHSIETSVIDSDLIIGAVLIKGAKAPVLINRQLLKNIEPGSAIVDVAVDQGGCVESMHPTTHNNPTFIVDDIVHYGVSNMPGVVPRTSTYALTHATMPYILLLAQQGFLAAANTNRSIFKGVNTYDGHITYDAVAKALDLPYTELNSLLKSKY